MHASGTSGPIVSNATRARRGLLVLLAGIFALSQTSEEADESVNRTRQTR